MSRSLPTYLVFIVQLLGLVLLVQGNLLWPLFLLGSFFLLIIVTIKKDTTFNLMIAFILSLISSTVYSIFVGGGFFAVLAWHLGLGVVYGMMRWYAKNSVHVSPLSLSVRASGRMTLSFVLSILTFFTLHFPLNAIGCDDITTIVEEYSPTIDQWVDKTDTTLPTITLSNEAPQRQNTLNKYLTQIEQTRKQKNTLDNQVCNLFIDSIHTFGKQTGVQLGSLGLLFALIYTIAYLPLLIISYLFAGMLYVLIALRLIEKKETTGTITYLS